MLAGIDRLCRTAIAAGCFVGLAALPALAGPITDDATKAEQAIGAGDAAGAIAAFDQATDAFWDAAPLAFRVATFADNVTGFGKYTPRGDATFHAGDAATIYLEPVGYGFAADGDNFRVSYATGIEIRTPGGLILGKTDDFGTADWSGRTKSHEVQAVVNVTLPTALPPGSYLLLLTLKDAATAKSATVTLPFTIAG